MIDDIVINMHAMVFRSGSILGAALSAILLWVAQPALAGPPFLTDDPEPTEPHHWEIYAPLIDVDGRGADFEGAAGVELNYGAARNLQLTLGLPIAYAHDATGWRWGSGDVELSAKYRFFHDEDAGIQIAAFPGVTLPTGSNGFSAGKVTALLPVWVQKDLGPWSIFGGGGYAINPGAGNRDYWTGGLAVSRHFGDRLLLGVEVNREGAGSVGTEAATRLGVGAIYQFKAPLRLLASGGPTFSEHHGPSGFHSFIALGLDF